MSILQTGSVRTLTTAICLWGLLLAFSLPAHAQFTPSEGITSSHWRMPVGEYGSSYCGWLNDNELLYASRGNPQYAYVKRNFKTGKTQPLQTLTNYIRARLDASKDLPTLLPSPNGKYLCWVVHGNFCDDLLFIATPEGVILRSYPSQGLIHYSTWSADSQWVFGFLEEGDRQIISGIYQKLIAVSVTNPALTKAYPIPQQSILSAAFFALPECHFNNGSSLLLTSSNPIKLPLTLSDLAPDTVYIGEYDFTNPARPTVVQSLHLPDSLTFSNSIVSPHGDAIAWKLRRGSDTEIWYSDRDGNHMKRLGKLAHPNSDRNNYDSSEIRWLPGGKSLSFHDADEFYVVQTQVATYPRME